MAKTIRVQALANDRVSLNIVASADVAAGMSEMASTLQGLPGGARLLRLIARRLRDMRDQEAREDAVLDGILPPVGTLSQDALTQLHWNAIARADAIREFGVLNSAQIAEIRGSRPANPHVATSRWLSAGRVFAIDTPGGRMFPAFQLTTEGEPRPVIGKILAALDGQLRGWETLLWFTGSNGNLDGARPVDLLDDKPDQVVAAAAHQASLSED